MPISMMVKGIGGEIGCLIVRSTMAMRREAFDAFHGAVGGRLLAGIRQGAGTTDLSDCIVNDRFYQKLSGTGDVKKNTGCIYAYGEHITGVEFVSDVPGRVRVTGKDGRTLDIDVRVLPETNVNAQKVNEANFLVDCTGVGFKDEKVPGYNFGNYGNRSVYPNLIALASAPVKKKIVGVDVPHHLNGLTLAEPGILNATGSCTTHAGVDLIRHIREALIQAYGLDPASDDVYIASGLLNAEHSKTPSDKGAPLELGNSVPGTTGFGGAAAVVYPVPGIANIAAATSRYDSFSQVGPWTVNGVSQFSLSLTVYLPTGKVGKTATADATADYQAQQAEVKEVISNALMMAARDREGRKHIGVVNPLFTFKGNKDGGFSLKSMLGMAPTTILPLGDNITVGRMGGLVQKNGRFYEAYAINVLNAAYDNRLGFTVDLMDEMNRITGAMLGQQVFPGFYSPEDIGDELALLKYPAGQAQFAKALEKYGKEIVLGHVM